MSSFLNELSNAVDAEWDRIKAGRFYQRASRNFERGLYIGMLIEIYHYTRHNSINQAVAAFATSPQSAGLLRFAYKHALEELGHENMVVRDLASIGIGESEILATSPGAATEALNGYLYSVALRQGALARLGYSFWAERAYEHIQPILESARRCLGLSDESMTFFVAHAQIDQRHAVEVQEGIGRWIRNEQDLEAVRKVATTTLYLTGKIMEEVLYRYEREEHESNRAAGAAA